MLAYHNDPELKASLIAQMRAHMEADELVRGQYWDMDDDGAYRGCAIGCLAHTEETPHKVLEEMAGIPRRVGYLIDTLFEHLPDGRFERWPLEVLEAIPVGADLSMVWSKMAVYLMDQAEQDDPSGSCAHVRDLYSRQLAGVPVDGSEWDDAAYAAARAVLYPAYAARAAARAAALYAALYAARAARAAARAADAAAAAAYAAAGTGAYAAHMAAYAARAAARADDAVSFTQQADHLLKLLRETEDQ